MCICMSKYSRLSLIRTNVADVRSGLKKMWTVRRYAKIRRFRCNGERFLSIHALIQTWAFKTSLQETPENANFMSLVYYGPTMTKNVGSKTWSYYFYFHTIVTFYFYFQDYWSIQAGVQTRPILARIYCKNLSPKVFIRATLKDLEPFRRRTHGKKGNWTLSSQISFNYNILKTLSWRLLVCSNFIYC